MSGVERDRDLGRKFESDASLIKAELKQKNLELSGSLPSASVSNKCKEQRFR
jgi:hypothetical protein